MPKAFIKTYRRSEDGSVFMSNGDCAQADENSLPGPVRKRDFGNRRLAIVHRGNDRVAPIRENIPVSVGVSCGTVTASDDILTQVAGDFFGPLVLEQDSLVAVDEIDSCLKALENSSKDLRGIKLGHGTTP
jgi:hypothetical protein